MDIFEKFVYDLSQVYTVGYLYPLISGIKIELNSSGAITA